MTRKLKVWNGGWYPFRGQHAYVCAYSQKDVLVLLEELFGHKHNVTLGEIQRMWSPCWGTPMDGVERERGMWLMGNRGGTPVRVQPGTLA